MRAPSLNNSSRFKSIVKFPKLKNLGPSCAACGAKLRPTSDCMPVISVLICAYLDRSPDALALEPRRSRPFPQGGRSRLTSLVDSHILICIYKSSDLCPYLLPTST